MTRKDVQDAGHTWKRLNPDERIVGSKLPWSIQLAEAVDRLNWSDFDTEPLKIPIRDKADSEGVVFGLPNRIQKLRRRGHLTIMDSTHCTQFGQIPWLDAGFRPCNARL